MISLIPAKAQFFIPFEASTDVSSLPRQFTLFREHEPHPLSLQAAMELQHYLRHQDEWQHNFGLAPEQEGTIIGKMFGVLVVQTRQDDIGYLAAFSGKLAGSNQHAKFVPPVFDGLTDNSFLNEGMEALTLMSLEIEAMEKLISDDSREQVTLLKTARKDHSRALQKEIFNQYHFLNRAGAEKSLTEIFQLASYKNPPVGAGECAAPKLLQYAFQHQMKPLAMAEFWWGLSPKSGSWKHGHFYPCCRHKCGPILDHMLAGIDCQPV